jgi:MarR family transcriptional regulator for hemolysin
VTDHHLRSDRHRPTPPRRTAADRRAARTPPLAALPPRFVEPVSIASESDLLILLHDVTRQMRTYADAEARSLGTTRAQLMILARLGRAPDVSQSELASVVEVAPITIARLVDRLEVLGLVKRCTDPKDRRIWRLRLTPAGARLSGVFKRLLAKQHSAMTAGIDPAVLDGMTVGLRRMNENVIARRSTRASVAEV